MHLHRVGAYLGNYLSTFFCVLIFIQIDPNLRIASDGQIFTRFSNLLE